MNRKRMEKPKWWRRFWPLTIIACSVLIVLDGILYLLGYTALSQLFGGILVVFAAIPLTYGIWHLQIRYQTTKKMQLINKIAFIGTGGFVAWVITFFGGAFIIWAVKGMPKPSDPPPQYPALIFIVIFIVPWIVGGFIGYLIGKRRNYRPYI
jgi:hypothetical protein